MAEKLKIGVIGLGPIGQILAVFFEEIIFGDELRIRFVLFAGQMCVPWRQTRAARDPQTMRFRRIDVVIFDQTELAGLLILIQR